MNGRFLNVIASLSLAVLSITAPAHAAQSPVAIEIEVSQIYDNAAQGAVFIYFKPNPSAAMPGCYADGGGYLFRNNSNFQNIYAILMTQMATKRPITGYVLYTSTGPPQNLWSDCNIDGLYLVP